MAIIPITIADSDNRIYGDQNERHNGVVAKASISPSRLNQPLAGRTQEVGGIVIVIVI